MIGKKKSLEKILGAFTKAKTELEAFIRDEQQLQADLNVAMAELEDQRLTSEEQEEKAMASLKKINEIIG